MKYKSFRLKNFRGIDDIKVSLDQDSPVCLLGSNEAGKTTILEGIQLIGHLVSEGPISGWKNKIAPKKNKFTDSVILEAYIEFDKKDIRGILPSADSSDEEKCGINKVKKMLDENPILNIKFIHIFKDTYQDQEIEIFCGDKAITWKEFFRNFLSEKAPEVIHRKELLFSVPDKIRFVNQNFNTEQYPEYKDDVSLNKEENKSWQDIFSDILSSATNSNADFQRDVVNILVDDPNLEDNVENLLSGMRAHLDKTITKAWAKTVGQRTFSSILINNAVSKGEFYDYQIRVEAGKNSFKLSERSKGAQWFFCFMLLTTIKAARCFNGAVFLLDEPATNLHIEYQARIYEAMKKLSTRKNISVVYSTHSPSLVPFTEKEKDALLLVCNKFKDTLDNDSAKKITAKNYRDIDDKDMGNYSSALLPLIEGNLIRSIINNDTKQNQKPVKKKSGWGDIFVKRIADYLRNPHKLNAVAEIIDKIT